MIQFLHHHIDKPSDYIFSKFHRKWSVLVGDILFQTWGSVKHWVELLILQSKHVLLHKLFQNCDQTITSPSFEGRPHHTQVRMIRIVDISKKFRLSSISSFLNFENRLIRSRIMIDQKFLFLHYFYCYFWGWRIFMSSYCTIKAPVPNKSSTLILIIMSFECNCDL